MSAQTTYGIVKWVLILAVQLMTLAACFSTTGTTKMILLGAIGIGSLLALNSMAMHFRLFIYKDVPRESKIGD